MQWELTNVFLPRIPSMLWLDLPPSEPLRSVQLMLPPRNTRTLQF